MHLLYYPISLHLTFHCRDASSGIHCVRLETSSNIDYGANKGFEILLPALSSARIHVAFQHRYPFPAVHSCSVTEISLNIDIEKNGEIKCALIFLFHVHSPCFQHHCVSPGLQPVWQQHSMNIDFRRGKKTGCSRRCDLDVTRRGSRITVSLGVFPARCTFRSRAHPTLLLSSFFKNQLQIQYGFN